jgi:hypothetical protein
MSEKKNDKINWTKWCYGLMIVGMTWSRVGDRVEKNVDHFKESIQKIDIAKLNSAMKNFFKQPTR